MASEESNLEPQLCLHRRQPVSADVRIFASLDITRLPIHGLHVPEDLNAWLSDYGYRQGTKQRAEEQVSHGHSKSDEIRRLTVVFGVTKKEPFV